MTVLRRPSTEHQKLYAALSEPTPANDARRRGAQFIHSLLAGAVAQSNLPEQAQDLHQWMTVSASKVARNYERYRTSRKEGAPREYFPTRAHALHFLKAASPTKLVDGSWLYGVLQFSNNPSMRSLIHTYVEELGRGVAEQNHVVLYRRLLSQNGLDRESVHDDLLYVQGLTQLALAWNPEEFLPEIIGFNLGYEQLPLHLLITAFELNELGIDPFYFTVHVTVDNHSCGHARAACDAVKALMPRRADPAAFWNRVRAGAALADAGISTTDMIERFDLGEEVQHIFQAKCAAGFGMHSDYCRIGGQTVNEWLSMPSVMPEFLNAMIAAGWIRQGEAPEASRFWRLLQGEHAEMFGVFSSYELQVIHDWIRGESCTDGAAWFETHLQTQPSKRRDYRAARLAGQRSVESIALVDNLRCDEGVGVDPDVPAFLKQLDGLRGPLRRDALVRAMSPGDHWTSVGLLATRVFVREALEA